jgi:hypothetical protein
MLNFVKGFLGVIFEIFEEIGLPFVATGVPFALLFGLAFLVAERAEVMGVSVDHFRYTDQTYNYGVFRKGRYIAIQTRYLPATIEEHDGKIVRTDILLKQGLVVKLYNPASPAEQALWHRYFNQEER